MGVEGDEEDEERGRGRDDWREEELRNVMEPVTLRMAMQEMRKRTKKMWQIREGHATATRGETHNECGDGAIRGA